MEQPGSRRGKNLAGGHGKNIEVQGFGGPNMEFRKPVKGLAQFNYIQI